MFKFRHVRFWLPPLTLLACLAVGTPAIAQAQRAIFDAYELVKVGHRSHGYYGGRHYKHRHGHHYRRHHRHHYPFGHGRHYYRHDRYYGYGDYYRGYRYPPYGLHYRYEGRRYGFDYSPHYGFGLYLNIR